MLKVLASTVQTVSFDRDTNGWMTRINLLNNDDVIDECIDRFDSLSILLFYKTTQKILDMNDIGFSLSWLFILTCISI